MDPLLGANEKPDPALMMWGSLGLAVVGPDDAHVWRSLPMSLEGSLQRMAGTRPVGVELRVDDLRLDKGPVNGKPWQALQTAVERDDEVDVQQTLALSVAWSTLRNQRVRPCRVIGFKLGPLIRNIAHI